MPKLEQIKKWRREGKGTFLDKGGNMDLISSSEGHAHMNALPGGRLQRDTGLWQRK